MFAILTSILWILDQIASFYLRTESVFEILEHLLNKADTDTDETRVSVALFRKTSSSFLPVVFIYN